ncbi:NAD-dependent epimerase/dehydratase family protein [Litoricolaceae bacterium]|nr:NAD-dependent epimerase/dehydratase family protein [Litorivicinaceae bacterium]
MNVVIVTGSSGLIGSAAVERFCSAAKLVVGIDNNYRERFFGSAASTNETAAKLVRSYSNFIHAPIDITNHEDIAELFQHYGSDISAVIHCAAQPSHDWAKNDPYLDFSINVAATVNLLESCRNFSPQAPFAYCSSNKVYGDQPNKLPLIDIGERLEIDAEHIYFEKGINESMSIDQSTHSLFGAGKASADLYVQEYGKYFGMHTACFRGGCLTGKAHAGAQLHGFLSFLVKQITSRNKYTVFGYGGKQVRDNIDASDVVEMFVEFVKAPRCGEVYNIGGGRGNSCSVREAITLIEEISNISCDFSISDAARVGDHAWYISDTSKFESHYPDWKKKKTLRVILEEMVSVQL